MDESLARMMRYTSGNQTSDYRLATFLVATERYVLLGIEGPANRRVFRFDREIPIDVVRRFHASAERRLLDVHRSLKSALMASGSV